MTEAAVLDYLHRRSILVATLAPHVSSRGAWVGIYPLDLQYEDSRSALRRFGVSVTDPEQPLYRIRVFEVERSLIEADVCFGEEEIWNRYDAIAVGDDELRSKLAEQGIRLDQLDWPSRTDYPI